MEVITESKILVKHLDKSFGTNKILENINIDIKENEFLVILGAGQTGKSVLLNILAGLDEHSNGEVDFLGSEDQENIGYVFQRYALFPWKTVMGNVEMSPKLKGINKEERQTEAQKYIDLVGLTGFEESFPKELSGGMQQRVAIARAYATESNIMLFDEPFGALDAQTRYSMQDAILNVWERYKKTVVFVTNNLEEAIYLADRIILLGGDPTTVQEEFIPNLPRPRNQTGSDFLELRNIIADKMDIKF